MKLAVAVILAVFSGPAWGQGLRPYYDPSPQVARTDHSLFFYATPQLGFGAPLGLLGIEAGFGASWFRAGIGAGIGLRGPEVAAMARAMIVEVGPATVGLGAGVSRGPGVHDLNVGWSEPDERFVEFADGTVWGNGEVTVEWPVHRYAFMRASGGVSYAIDARCEVEVSDDDVEPCSADEHSMLGRWMPYVSVGAGFRFPAAW